MHKGELLKKITALLFVVIAAVSSLYLLAHGVNTGEKSDFTSYYTASRLVVLGQKAFCYSPDQFEQKEKELFPDLGNCKNNVYLSPPASLLVLPIGTLPLPDAQHVWKAVLVIVSAAGLFFLIKTFSLKFTESCLLIGGYCLSYPFFKAIESGETGPLLFLSMAGALYFLEKRKDILAGLLLSLMILKLQFVVPFIVYLIGCKRGRSVAVFAGVFALLTVIAYLIYGSAAFGEYLTLMRPQEISWHRQPQFMPTVLGQLLRFSKGNQQLIFFLTALIYLAMAWSSWFCGSDNRKSEIQIYWAYMVTIPLTLISSLVCQDGDLLILLPMVLSLMKGLAMSVDRFVKFVVCLICLSFVCPLGGYIEDNFVKSNIRWNIWFLELLALQLIITVQLSFRAHRQLKNSQVTS